MAQKQPHSNTQFPTTEEADIQKKAVTTIVRLLFVLCIVIGTVTIALDPRFSNGQITTIVLAGVFGLMLLLIKRGYVRAVARTVLVTLLITTTYMLYDSGSIANTDLSIYFFILIFATIVVSRRTVLLIAFVSVVALTVLFYLEQTGVIKINARKVANLGEYFTVVAMLLSTLWALWYVIAQKDKQYQQVLTLNATLSQSQAEQAALIQSLPDLFVRFTAQGEILSINQTQLLDDRGVRLEKGESIFTFFNTPVIQKRMQGFIQKALAENALQQITAPVKLGTEDRLIDFRLMPIDKAELMVICRDVTEDRKLRDTVYQANKLDSIGILAGGIAHDFNNWLTGVIVQLALAQKRVTRLLNQPQAAAEATKILSHLQKSSDSAHQAAELTKQLLVYAGKKQPELSSIQLNALVTESVALMDAALDKRIIVECALKQDLPTVNGDATQLQQVVVNLILNAGEAITQTTGTINICSQETSLDATNKAQWQFIGAPPANGSYVHISIKDTGSGIKPQLLRNIFDPFFTTKKTGKGLGLSAVLGIVQAHKGGLSVRSELDVGTEFDVFLPVSNATLAQRDAQAPITDTFEGTVLIIDDEAAVRDAAASTLEMNGICVFIAADGPAGLAMLAANQKSIELILLDVQMPKMNGVDVLSQLRQDHPQLPVILSTGYTDLDLNQVQHTYNVAAILNKPYLPRDLLQLVAKHLRKQS